MLSRRPDIISGAGSGPTGHKACGEREDRSEQRYSQRVIGHAGDEQLHYDDASQHGKTLAGPPRSNGGLNEPDYEGDDKEGAGKAALDDYLKPIIVSLIKVPAI